MSDFDFTTLDPQESEKERRETKAKTLYEIQARHMRAMRKELHMHGGKVLNDAQLVREAANPVSQMEYNCRKFALLNIIRNPELSAVKNPLANSWKTLYPSIPYNIKATNWNIRKADREFLIEEMKKEGVWKHTELMKVQHFVDRVHTYYLANKVIDLEKRVKTLELQLADNGNIWYSGVEIVKLARTFKVVVGETTIETRHGTFDKLFDFLGQIDERLI